MTLNLLDESLGGGWRMVLIEDFVETSGAFLVHHLLKRSLSQPQASSDVVVFLSFAHPFSHYDSILRKMGCNLAVQRDNKRLLFVDMLASNRAKGKTSEDLFLALYGEVQKAIEVSSSPEGMLRVTIIIDDISLMEVDANGSSNLVLDFLHYCYSLTTQSQLEYLADVVIKAETLGTGLATDVHGQQLK